MDLRTFMEQASVAALAGHDFNSSDEGAVSSAYARAHRLAVRLGLAAVPAKNPKDPSGAPDYSRDAEPPKG